MRVHHLNCATMCPPGGRLLAGKGRIFSRGRMVCHCLLVEAPSGLVLVDTGFGLAAVDDPGKYVGSAFRAFVGPRLDASETAVRQVEALGFRADDVRDVLVTHLDLDHAGGLADFPRARVHVHDPELGAALARATLAERRRYRPAQWVHGPAWAPYAASGEPWNGFECARGLEGLPPEILALPLPGHTRGHAAIAVRGDDGWLVHAGDAYFFRGEMSAMPRCPAGLAVFQARVAVDDAARCANRDRLRALALDRSLGVRVFCAHDPVEWETLARPDAAAVARPPAAVL